MRAENAHDTGFDSVACDLCGSDDAVPDYDFDVRGQPVSIVRCRACGMRYLNPRPTAALLPVFYGEGYYSYTMDEETAGFSDSFKDRLKATVMARHLGYPLDDPKLMVDLPAFVTRAFARYVAVPRFRRDGRLLDVGCGAGMKLLEYRALGWSVRGLELSPAAAADGAKRGLAIDVCPVEDAPFPDRSFDAITFYHSLEHLPSPSRALASARRLLAPDGQLLIVVPNYGSLERRLYGRAWGWMQIPVHFYHFTRRSLSEAIAKAGFEIEWVGYSFAGESIVGPAEGALAPLGRIVSRFSGPFALVSALLGSGKALIVSARPSA